MADDDLPPDDASELLGALGDLGRRIDAAKADAEVRTQAPPPRRFPMAWVAVALLVALVSGGLVLASGDDDGDELASGGTGTSATAPSTTALADGASTASTDGGEASTGAGPSTTAAPTETSVEPTTTGAPTTTEAPSTTAPPTTASPTTTTAPPATTPATAPATTPPDDSDADGPDQTAAAPGEVTVVAGDSFWRIAEQQVTQQLGHPPTVDEVTAYWVQLLDLNADRLVRLGNPNLIYPGQVLVLPAAG